MVGNVPQGNRKMAGVGKLFLTSAAGFKATHNLLNLVDVLVVNTHGFSAHCKQKLRRTGSSDSPQFLNLLPGYFTWRWPDLPGSSGAICAARPPCDEGRP